MLAYGRASTKILHGLTQTLVEVLVAWEVNFPKVKGPCIKFVRQAMLWLSMLRWWRQWQTEHRAAHREIILTWTFPAEIETVLLNVVSSVVASWLPTSSKANKRDQMLTNYRSIILDYRSTITNQSPALRRRYIYIYIERERERYLYYKC